MNPLLTLCQNNFMKHRFFLLFVLASVTTHQSLAQQADLILTNGKIWTGNSPSIFAEAVAIKGNKVIRVGTSAEIRSLGGTNTKVIDLQGKLASPGFNDAHIHFLSGSLGLSEVDLTGASSIEEMINRINEFAQSYPNRKWITGRGWQYTQFPGGLPTKNLIDAAIKDRPVYIRAYDGHSSWVNSKALELAGINRSTTFTGFGEIVRDANGEPTGALKEDAQGLVSKLLPPPTREEKMGALRKGLKLAASLGITSMQNAHGSSEEFTLYEELLSKRELTIRTAVAFSVDEKTTQAEIESFTTIKSKMGKNPLLQANAVKIMLDGVIESHTGAMLEPYSDLAPNESSLTGDLAMPRDEFYRIVQLFDKLGFQIYTHAIGDRAVREALNAYEITRAANGGKDSRYRIEHIEMIATEDMPRFAKLGVLASMEPIHADPGSGSVWSSAVGEKRLPNAFAWASLLSNQATLVYSSDWPACISMDPIRGLHTAVTRRTTEGQPENGWVANQKVTMEQALLAYTQRGAYASFEEDVKGKIAPGMLADIVVFSQDLFTINPMKTHETKVVMTIFDGQIIYRSDH